MAYRSNAPDLPRRYEADRDRYSEIRDRFEDDDDRLYVRRVSSRPPPPRDRSVDDRSERRFRPHEEDGVVFRERERRRVVYDDEPLRRRPSPPPDLRRRSPPPLEFERSSRVVIEKERFRSPSPPPLRRPPRPLRRQSSLDTFDRRPRGYFERDEYDVPARRDDYRVPPYVDMPLPRSRALPPPRVYDREYYDEIQVSDPHRFGDEDFHIPGERVREREIVRTRRRTRSRESRATRRSRSSSTSSSSSSGGTTLRSEYPKKGKTRIPARLVSKRALIDLGYPFIEEGKTIVVQKALGQQNIDDLLKLSDDYKKSELEIIAARSSAGDIIEERRTEIVEMSAPPRASNGPVIIDARPPPQQPVEVVKTTLIRDVSPDRRTYTTASYDTSTSYDTTSYATTSTSATPVIVDTRAREVSERVPVGPLALVTTDHRSRSVSRPRRGSRDSDELRSEIRHLERQLARRERRSSRGGGELVRAERLSTGELVLYEEEVETLEEPARGGVRIEKDKRGRLSISVPRRR